MEKSIKIESSISKLNEIDDFLSSLFEYYMMDKSLSYHIYLSINEAVNNAIQHGNKYDNTKFVKVSFSKEAKFYEFIIEDEGNGFESDEILDPTLEVNLRNESGRGLFIMKNFSDNLEILDCGKKIKINFLINRD